MRFHHLLIVGAASLTATGATAQSPGSPLSLAGLNDCAARSLAAQQRTAREYGVLAQLPAARAAVTRQTAAIEAERATIDRRNAAQVADFNYRVARACADYAAYVSAYNAVISVRNIHAAAFNADCADRDFSPAMVASLSAGLQAAWQAVAGGEDSAMLSVDAMPSMPQPLAR